MFGSEQTTLGSLDDELVQLLSLIKPTCLRIEASNLSKEWREFKQRFDIYMTATESAEKPEPVKIAIFLNLIGVQALQVYNTFKPHDSEAGQTLDRIMQLFDSYCTPRKNLVAERYQFWKLVQSQNESIDAFATSLRIQAASCEFGDQTESIIRDRIVFDTKDKSLLERFIGDQDLTLNKALDMCRANEVIKRPDSSGIKGRPFN